MAAKQGTLAQLSQAGEDAKRAVLSRTGVTSSWFSNLNTVCTIKSAPPRSPEVLQLLATKSGWLFKRNEQHVWQVRWCCAVPHTFLYYFDANIVPTSANGTGGTTPVLTQPTPQQQEEWNRAVASGYGNRKQHEKRGNFNFFTNNNNANTATASSGDGGVQPPNTAAVSYNNAVGDDNHGVEFKDSDMSNSHFSANMQPSGIIDLECYTSVHRSSFNPNVLELAGDDQVNPDLRSFYFCASSASECEDWTDALLNGRHSALVDECDAYKQVCDGFAQQLQMLHSDLDDAARAQEEADAELYRVRSQMEELRRTVTRLVEHCLDRTLVPPIQSTGSNSGFHDEMKTEIDLLATGTGSMDEHSCIVHSKRMEVRRNLETIHAQDMGVPALTRLLTEYCAFLEDTVLQQLAAKTNLERQLQQTGQSDQQRVHELEAELELLKHQKETELNQYKETVETLQGKCQQSQKELQDVQHELNSTRMEVTMYQSQLKTKLAELHQHKKILKKEVLDLRSALDEKESLIRKNELQQEKDKLSLEKEKSRVALLEKYVKKIESQVQVQHNMMEMMSHSGVGSVYGGGSVYVGGHNGSSKVPRSVPSSPGSIGSRNNTSRNNKKRDSNRNDISSIMNDDDDDDDDNKDIDDGGMDTSDQTDDMADSEPHGVRPSTDRSSIAGGSTRSNRTAHRKNKSDHHSSKIPQKKAHNSRQQQRQEQMMMDQDIDNKSHVSDITEDRTQRQFDAFTQFANAAAAAAAAQQGRSLGDIAEFVSKQHHHSTIPSPRVKGPPLHIIGVNNKTKNQSSNITEEDEDVDHDRRQRHNSLDRSMLETINKSSASSGLLPQSGHSVSNTPNGRRDIPRAGGGGGGSASISSKASVNSTGKLSVAQRARLEADLQSTPVKVRLDDKLKSSPTLSTKSRGKQTPTTNKQVISTPPKNEQHQKQHSPSSQSLPSGLWQRVEEAVLGSPSSSDEDDSDSVDSRDGTGSFNSTRVTDYTDDQDFTSPPAAQRKINNKNQNDSSSKTNSVKQSHEFQEEKKTPEPERALTLQERMQLQREQQINFLREQGLVKEESSIRGGAGVLCDSASVSSSTMSPSRSFLLFPNKLRSSPSGNHS